jgi:hypothetical protein
VKLLECKGDEEDESYCCCSLDRPEPLGVLLIEKVALVELIGECWVVEEAADID